MTTFQNYEDVFSMILVMGVTGAGKSYFINQLAGGNIVETGGDLNSCKLSIRPPLFFNSSLLTE